MMLGKNMDRLLAANVSIENIWILPTPHPSEAFKERLEMEDELPEELRQFVAGWEAWQIEELMEGDSDAWEHFTQLMMQAGWCGFWVEASTPVMVKSGKYKSFSWGYTHGNAFINTDLDKALEQACEWAELMAQKVEG